MRNFIRYKDVKKELRDDYFICRLYNYHNVLASMERRFNWNGEYDEEDKRTMRHLEELMLEWAMMIEERDDEEYKDLKGKLIKDCLKDHVYVDPDLKAILKPERELGEYVGVNDKNGVSIRVNDVVKTDSGDVLLVVHTIEPGRNAYELVNIDKDANTVPSKRYMWDSQKLEVITDKYDEENE